MDEFRDPAVAKEILKQIHATVTQPWVIMEICGGQTHSIIRNGILWTDLLTFFTKNTVLRPNMNSVTFILVNNFDSRLFRIKYLFLGCRASKLA